MVGFQILTVQLFNDFYQIFKLLFSHVHPSEVSRACQLSLHLSLEVDEQGGQVLVGVVGDASCRDTAQELGGGELWSHVVDELVDKGTQWNTLLVQMKNHPDTFAGFVDLQD